MTLLERTKANLMVNHHIDDELIEALIAAAKNYAEDYQHLEKGYYNENEMTPVTEQGVVMLASFLYESRDGSTGGFWGDNTQAPATAFDTINRLLRLGREWQI